MLRYANAVADSAWNPGGARGGRRGAGGDRDVVQPGVRAVERRARDRVRFPPHAIGIPTEHRDLLLLVLCGVFFAADLAALHAAVNLTTAANAILFLNAQPIYVSVGAWLL
ncbi:MAG: hypothetical protein OXK79_13350, partial [Chloroflexota bacterium]|nr:hypothetical protein [Chloroflexota bacterium]